MTEFGESHAVLPSISLDIRRNKPVAPLMVHLICEIKYTALDLQEIEALLASALFQ